jgi:hypothetical protein
MTKKRRRLPSVYVDEHMDRAVAKVFRYSFRTVEVSRDRKLQGRDERDYLQDLYRDNAIFVTSDIRFSREMLERDVKHAGIVYIPDQMAPDEKVIFAWIAREYIEWRCDEGPFAMRRQVIYPANDGLRVATAKEHDLEFSWDRFRRQLPDGFWENVQDEK